MSALEHFWNKEYTKPKHILLSDEPAEDLLKFTRWLLREYGKAYLNPTTKVLDLGVGNGRNLLFLAREFGIHGVGYDISRVAIEKAEAFAKGLPLSFSVRSLEEGITAPDRSFLLILDMMTSHYLRKAAREKLREEIVRVLKPGGFLFFKSFLGEGDLHVERLLRENPADEEYAYIHPEIGVYEYVWSEERLREFFEPYFEIRKLEKTHRHMLRGKAFKRRSVIAYLQKR